MFFFQVLSATLSEQSYKPIFGPPVENPLKNVHFAYSLLVRQSQRRHLQAARSIISSSPGSSAVSQPPSPSDRASSAVLNDILSQVEEAVPRTMTPRDPGPAQNNLSSDPTADTHEGNGKHAD